MNDIISHKMRFCKVGGQYQLLLENIADLESVLELDPALWAMTGVQIDSMICDREFLDFVDDDHNKKIRSDEVRRALRWLLDMLKDRSGIVSGDSTLNISALNANNPEASEMLKTIRVVLDNFALPDSVEITLEQIRNREKLIADPLRNGDGIIPPDKLEPPLAELVTDIMTLYGNGKKTDITGIEGVDKTLAETFEKDANAYLAWCAEADAVTLPFGEQTIAVYTAFETVREKINHFFISDAVLTYTSDAADKRRVVLNTVDPLDAKSVAEFLEKSLIAEPTGKGILKNDERVNPAWRERLILFLNTVGSFFPFEQDGIRQEQWENFTALLAPCSNWLKRKNTSVFDSFDRDKLKRYLDGEELRTLKKIIAEDEAAKKNIDLCNSVKKLILYQKYMFEFLNNYVCMHRLFDPDMRTMLQAGSLVMDGRHFTLAMIVHNPSEHKRIAANSDICTMYLEIATGEGPALQKMTIAVAVTSGHMRNLFVGKCGVFFTPDGRTWDAKVTDFIQQPVSIPEALTMPFYKFGDFLGKQADKFFTARSKNFEKEMEANIQNQLNASTSPTPAKTQSPAFSGSMILMGGGVGIAAIGSSVAFIAKTLQNVSIWNVLAILFGVLFVFGAPIITVSLIKLHRRSIALFLEANGFALNRQMRLTRRLGPIFTYTPRLPKESGLAPEKLVKILSRDIQESRTGKKTFFLTVFSVTGVLTGGFLIGLYSFLKYPTLQETAGQFMSRILAFLGIA